MIPSVGMKVKMPFLETIGVYGTIVAVHPMGTIDVEYNGKFYRLSGLAA